VVAPTARVAGAASVIVEAATEETVVEAGDPATTSVPPAAIVQVIVSPAEGTGAIVTAIFVAAALIAAPAAIVAGAGVTTVPATLLWQVIACEAFVAAPVMVYVKFMGDVPGAGVAVGAAKVIVDGGVTVVVLMPAPAVILSPVAGVTVQLITSPATAPV